MTSSIRLSLAVLLSFGGCQAFAQSHAQGFFERNPHNAYSVNNVTGQKNPDGPTTVQYGGCDGKIPNCLPIVQGWNYAVRLYRPHEAALKGTWKFPELKAAT